MARCTWLAAPTYIRITGIRTTNLTIILPFTLDLTPPASRADKLFSIAFAAQLRERRSCARDSRGVRTLTNDLQRGVIISRRGVHHGS